VSSSRRLILFGSLISVNPDDHRHYFSSLFAGVEAVTCFVLMRCRSHAVAWTVDPFPFFADGSPEPLDSPLLAPPPKIGPRYPQFFSNFSFFPSSYAPAFRKSILCSPLHSLACRLDHVIISSLMQKIQIVVDFSLGLPVPTHDLVPSPSFPVSPGSHLSPFEKGLSYLAFGSCFFLSFLGSLFPSPIPHFTVQFPDHESILPLAFVLLGLFL